MKNIIISCALLGAVTLLNGQNENLQRLTQALDSLNGKAYDYAIPVFKELINKKYKEEVNYEFLISTYMITDSINNGIKYVNTAHKKFPNNATFLKYAIDLYAKKRDYNNVLVYVEKALKLEPNNDLLYTYLGNLYTDLHDYEKALHNYKQAQKLNQKSFMAFYGEGTIYVNRAVELKKKMNELNFNDSKYDAFEKEEKNLNAKAIKSLEKALEIKSEDKAILSGLLQLYLSVNDLEKYKETKAKLKALRGY
ncbi:tetratricopeptide repeat protein [Seonamhaeicola marinus]|uniref:Uncharacterized protein n=1 Tax=Seonamhaeicola marinus TaxID=1912246 RepID=A0A5D0HZP0_9FLAO|nr:tetratricopeptide repeat protein [Seonamhaeicola marinus]TYA74982.1 hypothetical protein FUA24_16920 [Seonamhaeicola marinus]